MAYQRGPPPRPPRIPMPIPIGAALPGTRGAGAAAIIATSEGVADTASVTVAEPSPLPAASIELSADSISMETGTSVAVRATVLDSLGVRLEPGILPQVRPPDHRAQAAILAVLLLMHCSVLKMLIM